MLSARQDETPTSPAASGTTLTAPHAKPGLPAGSTAPGTRAARQAGAAADGDRRPDDRSSRPAAACLDPTGCTPKITGVLIPATQVQPHPTRIRRVSITQ